MAQTALQMIARSMRLIGALGRGETPTADEQTDGLTALNAMLQAMSIQRLIIYHIQVENFSWPAATASRTIGPSADFDTARPVRIERAWQRLNNQDYPVNVINFAQWSRIQQKNLSTSIADRIYLDNAFPIATLYLYQVPSDTAQIYLQTWKALQSFPAATTEISLPPGYEDMLVFNLAIALAGEYQRSIPQQVTKYAASTMRAIKRLNAKVPNPVIEAAFVGSRREVFDYRTGE